MDKNAGIVIENMTVNICQAPCSWDERDPEEGFPEGLSELMDGLAETAREILKETEDNADELQKKLAKEAGLTEADARAACRVIRRFAEG